MTLVIPVWLLSGVAGFVLGIAFAFWLGIRINRRLAAKAPADAVQAVLSRSTRG